MDSDSDDDYWGSYERLPQETRVPFSSGGGPRGLDNSKCGSIGSTPSTCSQDTVDLEPGMLISVGNSSFELNDLLGVGSFGSVWCASCQSSGARVALKEILTSNKDTMEAAKLEAQRLHVLQHLTQDSGCAALPHLLAAATGTHGSGYRTVLVMERVPGEPLRKALEGGQLQVQCQGVAHAFGMVSGMLRQLAGVMHPLSNYLLHRDAHSQNILVEASSGRCIFGLIDFGLAVDAMSWTCGAWRSGASGDGRFWPISSWMLFTRGVAALEASQDLVSEYTTQLDLHSIGLSALQALVILASEDIRHQQEPLMRSLQELRNAWAEYWGLASSCWERVLDAFNRDARAAIKMELSQEEVHETFARHFTNLNEKLVKVRDTLDANPGFLGDHGLAQRVIEALLLMISTGRASQGSTWGKVLQLSTSEVSSPGAGHLHRAAIDEVLRIDAPGKWQRRLLDVMDVPA